MTEKRLLYLFFFIFFGIFYYSSANAENRIVKLHIGYHSVNFTGKKVPAIAINGQMPAPTLRFKEGDTVTIQVYNHLHTPTSLHWHGLLVPWQMDGVEGISQQGIPPNGMFTYRFTLKQSGTYWYHSHAGLQEQQGLYGGIIVEPKQTPAYSYDRDFVIVLSDWINTKPEQVFANLKKDGDYYGPRFPLQPSLAKFIADFKRSTPSEKQQLFLDYQMMQKMRMSLYDLSDVAYDAFLLNGKTKQMPWKGLVALGETVRLRFIGAGAGTIFRVKIPNSLLNIIHLQGNDVKAYKASEFTLAPGETVDVLVKITQPNTYIYAESRDKVGAVYGVLLTYPYHPIHFDSIVPFPEPKPVTQEMHHNMMLSMHDHASPTSMPIEPTIQDDKLEHTEKNNILGHHQHQEMNEIPKSKIPALVTVGTPYQNVVSLRPTNYPDKPIAALIKMELFGYMDRFIWFINGVPEYKAKPILFEPNKRYRLVFTNTSMMHHPMHIHGHWFILRNGHGRFDPLLHTIDVPPGATVVADVDTDASGQWFFHCHLLYHMNAGMSRVMQYSTLIELANSQREPENEIKNTEFYNRPIVRVDEAYPLNLSLIRHPGGHSAFFAFASFFDIGMDPFHNVGRMTYRGLYGPDYHKLQLLINDAEIDKGKIENADIDIFYWHLLSQFWAVKGGANYFYRPALTPYWQPGLGLEGLMPYFIETDVRGYYHSGSAKLDLELSRATQITNNFFLQLGVRGILASKTIREAALGSGLNQMRYTVRPFYRLMPGVTIYTEYEHDQNYGSFRRIEIQAGQQSAVENTLTLGFTVLI